MSYFIALLLVLALTFSLCYLCKQKFEIMFALSIFGIILFLYIFGLLEMLKVGSWLAFGGIIVLFAGNLIKIIVEKDKSILKLFFTKISIVFLCVAVVQFPVFYFSRPYIMDDLSHWGIVVKNMYYFGDFGCGEFSTDMFKGYPRATSLFLYFFEFFGTFFHEGALYMAMNLLNVGLMLPIFSIFERKVNKNAFMLCLLCVFGLPVLFFPVFYNYIYVDHYLGVIFAYCLISYFKDRKLSLFTIINLSLAFAVMILSKNTGIVLSLFVVICRREVLKEFFKNKLKLLYLAIPVVAMVFAKLSWSIYIDVNLQQQVWDTKEFSIGALFKYMFSPNAFQSQVNKNFGLIIVDITTIASSSMFYLCWAPILTFVVIGVLLYLLYRKTKDKKFIVSLSVVLAICLAIYLYGLLVAYVFTFNEFEALNGASFHRYYSTLPLGIILFLVYQIFNVHVSTQTQPEKSYVRNRNSLFAGLSIFSIILIVAFPVISIFTNALMKPYDRYSEFCQTLDYRTDSVYYVNVYNDKQTMKRARYVSTPVDSCGLKNGGSFGDGTMDLPEEWGDPFLETTTFEKLQKKLSEEYNYLYLHFINDEFKEKFGDLFERDEDIIEDRFYKTEMVDGKLLITLLDF